MGTFKHTTVAIERIADKRLRTLLSARLADYQRGLIKIPSSILFTENLHADLVSNISAAALNNLQSVFDSEVRKEAK